MRNEGTVLSFRFFCLHTQLRTACVPAHRTRNTGRRFPTLHMTSYLQIILSMSIWSTWGLMIRWMDLPAVVVLFYTASVAGVAVPVFLRSRGELNLSAVRTASVWLLPALAAASIANNLTYFYALGHTSVANAVFTHYTAPLFVAVLAPLLIAERLQRVTLVSLPVAACGMVLVVLAGGGLRLGSGDAAGIIAGTASGVAYAVLIIASRELSRRLMHTQALILLLWTTVAVTAPAAFSRSYELDRLDVLLLFIGGILHSTVAPLLYYHALRHVLAQYAAILGYLEPLAAIPLAMVFLGEAPSAVALLGGCLILLSGFLVVFTSSKRRVSPSV